MSTGHIHGPDIEGRPSAQGSKVAADGPQPADHAAALRVLHKMLEPRVLGPLAGALAVVLGLLAVHALHGRVHLGQLRAAVADTPPRLVLLSLLCTGLSYVGLAGYDVLAVQRVAPGQVSPRLAGFAGMVAYGFSNALGFHVFIGGPVRWRIYQSAQLDAADVGRIVSLSVLTAWGGMLAVIGLTLLLAPAGLPALQRLSPGADRWLGAAVLAVLAGFLLWLARRPRKLAILGWRLALPNGRQTLAQIAVGALDYGATAGALYVLLPPDVAPPFAAFAMLFILASIAGVISHAPGGLGVFDATVLIGLGAGARPDVLAALVVFRLVYYVLPLICAAIALLCLEVWRARQHLPSATDRALALTQRIVPPAAAGMAFVGGLVLLLSGSTPSITARLDLLRQWLPLPFAEASHLLASLIGLLLVVVAHGLYRRLQLARQLAIVLLIAGAAFSLTKGMDWEEAGLMLLGAGFLASYGRAFYRGGGWHALRLDRSGAALLLIVLAIVLTLGLAAYRHVDYRSELWWYFAWHADAPRFLRATLLVGVTAMTFIVDAVIRRPAEPLTMQGAAVPPAVPLILQRSSSAESSVALLGDKRFLFSPGETAFVMYAVSGHSWITMGDPVGEAQAGRELVWRFAEAADRAGARAVFYAVQPAFLPCYLDLGLALLKMGELARVDLCNFALAGPARAGLRQAHRRAERDGLVFSVLPRDEVEGVLPELQAVSDAWLRLKHGREKGFSIGRFDAAYLSCFDCAVLRHEGRIVAFANLWRSGDGHELAVDLMRYRPGVSKVLMEALFVALFLYGKEQGYQWFNLGAAPLSGLSDHPMASAWDRAGTFIYKSGDEFYNFSGLRAFKEKFDPVWTPQYLACRGGLSLTRALADVTVLISGGPMGVFRR